jgi:hypothetical protein
MLGETEAVRMAGGFPKESIIEELFFSQEDKNTKAKRRVNRRKEKTPSEPVGSI